MQVTKQKSLFDIVSTRAVITSDMFVYSSLSTRGEVNDTCRLFFSLYILCTKKARARNGLSVMHLQHQQFKYYKHYWYDMFCSGAKIHLKTTLLSACFL